VLVAGLRELDIVGRIRLAFQNPAHRGLVVFGGLAARRAVEEALQMPFEGDEFGDLAADLVEAGVQELSNMPTRRLAAVVDREDLAHLLQGQPCGLAAMDEPQPIHDLRPIVAIPRRTACGRR
jgi:hypothetical protein